LNASAVMKVCDVDLGALKETLVSYIDSELTTLVTGDRAKARPTAAFQRTVQRAIQHAQSRGRHALTGGDLLVALFDETESPAVWFLGEQDMTQVDAMNFILHGILRAGRGGAAGKAL